MNLTGFSICINQLQPLLHFFIFILPPFALRYSSMAFMHSEKLKTCDWDKKCLKYMDWNKLCDDSWTIMQIKKPVKFITPPDQVLV